MKFDLIIEQARIIDGTGQPAYTADVAVEGARIAAIGQLKGSAGRRIDARRLTLLPGLIDPHSHADLIFPLAPARQAELLRGKLAQGITTTLIGNCGLGCAPVRNGETEALLRAVNAWMTPEPTDWNWRGLGEFLSHLESNGTVMNVGTLAPHGPIRMSAMGLAKGSPSRPQMKRMREMVEESLREGAFGLSTGLIYPPGMYSAPDELTDLARIVARYDRIYTSHIRGSSETLIPAVKELIEIGRTTGARVHHSHNEAVGRAHWGKIDRVLAMEDAAEREGVRLSFDMFPYTAAATMMIAIYPPWALEGGIPQLIDRLKNPRLRRRIEREIERRRPSWPPWKESGWPHNLVKATGWEAIAIGYVAGRKNKRFENRNLIELARLTGKSPFDAISDLIVEEEGQVSMFIFEVSGDRDEQTYLEKFARHRLCAFCTDAEDYGRGLPHPAAYGAFPRILSRFVGPPPALSLEAAVHRMTQYPATLFGIKDRGLIRPGAFADLLLCDPRKINDRATYKNSRRQATGIDRIIINGSEVYEEGGLKNICGMVLRKN